MARRRMKKSAAISVRSGFQPSSYGAQPGRRGLLFPEDNTLRGNPNRATNRGPVSTRENWNEGTVRGRKRSNKPKRSKEEKFAPLPPGTDPYTRQLRARAQRGEGWEKKRDIGSFVNQITDKAWDQMGPGLQRDWKKKGGIGDTIRGVPGLVSKAQSSEGLDYQSNRGRKSQQALENRSRQWEQEQEARFRRNSRKRKRVRGGHSGPPNPKSIVDDAMNNLLNSLWS